MGKSGGRRSTHLVCATSFLMLLSSIGGTRRGWSDEAVQPTPKPSDSPQAGGGGGCGKDTDCKGDRICVDGHCAPPRTAGASVPNSEPVAAPPPPAEGSAPSGTKPQSAQPASAAGASDSGQHEMAPRNVPATDEDRRGTFEQMVTLAPEHYEGWLFWGPLP